jgi:hypothetical protein
MKVCDKVVNLERASDEVVELAALLSSVHAVAGF